MNDDTQATPAEPGVRVAAPQWLVDRYEIGGLLGRGGVGQVHEALDHRTGQSVAVKFVRPQRDFAIRQVRRELTALRALALPGVVRLLDDGMSQGQYFLVMSLVSGPSLDEALRGLSWEAGAPMVRALLATLGRVHLAGVFHRDLKPSNIRMDGSGQPVLIDFGLAWGSEVARMGVGIREGSPGFAAPEQWRGEAGDARTDVYACGRILRDWIQACGAPDVVHAMVARMLEEEPGDRPASMLEVLEAFGGAEATIRGRLPDLPHPATAEALRALFGGPRRSFFHLDRDAAECLFAWTHGDPQRLQATLAAWIDRGEARWNGEHFVMQRKTIDRLTLHAASSGRVETSLERLLEQANHAWNAGRLSVAWALLEPATLAGREVPSAERDVISTLVGLAIELEQLAAIEPALQVCERSGVGDATRATWIRLLRGARTALAGEAQRAMVLLDGAPIADERLERLRKGCVLRAASQMSLDLHERYIEQLTPEAELADVYGWYGGLSYRKQQWSKAAVWHERSLAARRLPHRRIAAQVNAGQSWLEALDFSKAHHHGANARRLARQLRHADFEARAAWILRTAAYRQGQDLSPDPEWVDAAFAVGKWRGALHAMTEAAIAWRAGAQCGSTLAEQAARGFRACGFSPGELLAQALHASMGGHPEQDPEEVIVRILDCGVAEVALQAAALWPGVRLSPDLARGLAACRPEAEWSACLDVLSIQEALRCIETV